MKHSEALKAAKELISLPENWTQGSYYKNTEGKGTCNRDNACAYCSIGALRHVNNIDDDDSLIGRSYLCDAAIQLNGEWCMPHHYNDTHSHAEVLALFDKAIELAEKAGE